jgi:translation initiation factor 5A
MLMFLQKVATFLNTLKSLLIIILIGDDNKMTGELKRKHASSFQVGNYIVIDGAPCTVSSIQISRPGKHGHAKVQLMGVGMMDGKKRQMMAPGHDEIDAPVIGKKNAQVLSVAGKMANIMDSETFETFDLEIPEELKDEVTEGVTVVYWEIMEHKVIKQIKKE